MGADPRIFKIGAGVQKLWLFLVLQKSLQQLRRLTDNIRTNLQILPKKTKVLVLKHYFNWWHHLMVKSGTIFDNQIDFWVAQLASHYLENILIANLHNYFEFLLSYRATPGPSSSKILNV